MRVRPQRSRRGFTLVELLVVLGLTAIVAVPLAGLLRGTITSQERTAETARAWQEAADLLTRLSDDIRAADEARALGPTHLKLTLAGEQVHYRGGRGLHRIVPSEGGGRWRSQSTETLIDDADETEVYFHVNKDGLVTLYLVGEEVRLRTAALPRGGVVDLVQEEARDEDWGEGVGAGRDQGQGKGR